MCFVQADRRSACSVAGKYMGLHVSVSTDPLYTLACERASASEWFLVRSAARELCGALAFAEVTKTFSDLSPLWALTTNGKLT